jgi:hypothetical protein
MRPNPNGRAPRRAVTVSRVGVLHDNGLWAGTAQLRYCRCGGGPGWICGCGTAPPTGNWI